MRNLRLPPRTSLLLAVVILVPLSSANAQIPDVEREALITLYNVTNGAGWTKNYGWVTGTVGTE